MRQLLPSVITSVKDKSRESNLPDYFHLYQNYPNPFNPETTIGFSIPANSNVSLKVYNILGKLVALLVNEEKEAGEYSISFNTSDYKLSAGVYFYRLDAGSFSSTKKLLLLK